jgi:23S rRNA (uridine2552-2'-O)-methyltransferase
VSRRGSTKRWLQIQSRDPFVKQRDAEGYRSRAAFKLKEILERDRLLKPGDRVLDLGGSPGGWSQVAKEAVGGRGTVVAVDLLAMEPLKGVHFIQGDSGAPEVVEAVKEALGGGPVDLVLSDMAPNLSGVRHADEARSVALAEVAIEAAENFLKPEGTILIKMFQHADTEKFIAALRPRCQAILRRKPRASREKSPEFYIVVRGFKL